MSGDDAFPLPGVSTMGTLPEWEQFFSAAAPSGVISGVGSELLGSLNSGTRQAVTASGAGMLRGFYKPVTSPTGVNIPAPSAQDRIDRLVLRLDRTAVAAADFVKPTVLTGTSGSTTPPTIATGATGNWDLPIMRWRSASSGALDGLVDERYWLADLAVFKSTARPAAFPSRPGFERDTLRFLWADGATWNTVSQDTGLVNLPLNTGAFDQGGIALQIGLINGICYLSGSVVLKTVACPCSVSLLSPYWPAPHLTVFGVMTPDTYHRLEADANKE